MPGFFSQIDFRWLPLSDSPRRDSEAEQLCGYASTLLATSWAMRQAMAVGDVLAAVSLSLVLLDYNELLAEPA